MTLPRPWPFMSPLAERAQPSDRQEPQEPKPCECARFMSVNEMTNNKCATCGKPLVMEVL